MSQAEGEVMQAGPELDARIEVLMGRVVDETRCQVCGWPLADTTFFGCVPGNCALRPAPDVRYDAAPPYSTDIAAAFTVVEKMRERGWRHATLGYVATDSRSCVFERGLGGDGERFTADAPTTPHAICLAALAALENAHV